MRVQATDEDVVARAAGIMGCACITTGRLTVAGKHVYTAEVCGKKAVAVMHAIAPHMGARRLAKITDVLSAAASRPGRPARGTEQPNAKLNEERVIGIRQLSADGVRQVEIARRMDISQALVSLVIRGRAWRHVSGSTVNTLQPT